MKDEVTWVRPLHSLDSVLSGRDHFKTLILQVIPAEIHGVMCNLVHRGQWKQETASDFGQRAWEEVWAHLHQRPHTFSLADQRGSRALFGASFQMWNQFVFPSFITNILLLFDGIPGNGTFLFCYILICLVHVACLSGPTNHWLSSQSMVCVQPISQTNTSFLVAVPDVGKSDLQSQ